MVTINLQANETVVLMAENVIRGGGHFSYDSGELILTNLNIIWLNTGMFGKVKQLEYFELNQIVVFNDRAQALFTKGSNSWPRLDVVFQKSKETFQFRTGGRSEVLKWADAVNQIVTGVTGVPADIRSSASMALPGFEDFADTLRDTVNQFKGIFGAGGEAQTPPMPAPPASSPHPSPLQDPPQLPTPVLPWNRRPPVPPPILRHRPRNRQKPGPIPPRRPNGSWPRSRPHD